MSKATNNTNRVTFGKMVRKSTGRGSVAEVFVGGEFMGRIEKDKRAYYLSINFGGVEVDYFFPEYVDADLYTASGILIERRKRQDWSTALKAAKAAAVAYFTTTEEPAQVETVEDHVVVTNDDGRAFSVVVVLEGERYGLDDCLTHGKPDPLVEFYVGTGEARAFTGGRYYLSTLAGEDAWSLRRGEGLDLNGGVRDWSVSWDNVCEAVAYARKREAHA